MTDINSTISQHDKNDATSIEYVVDKDNVIVEIRGLWDEFAIDNDAAQMVTEKVIGKPLMDFISGSVTRQFWLEMLHKTRIGKTPVCLDYRCDSPQARRYMSLRLIPESHGRLRLLSALLRSEERQENFYSERARERGKDTMTRCSLCNQILSRGQWVEAESLSNSSPDNRLQVIYGICPTCKLRL